MYAIIEELLKAFPHTISLDLAQAIYQKSYTTKQARRERAFAYLVEMFTGEMSTGLRYPSEQWVLNLLNAVDAAATNAVCEEAKVGLKRASKRLRKALSDPSSFIREIVVCVGCNETIERGTPHTCNSKSAKAKDAMMAYDDTIPPQ